MSSGWMYPTSHNIAPIGCLTGVFTPAQCEEIIRIGKSNAAYMGAVGLAAETKTIRNSKINFLQAKDNEWIFETLAEASIFLNNNEFKFELTGFAEGIQFAEYTAPDGRYTQHVDCLIGSPIRKLSISIQLSDEYSYVGGDLILTYAPAPLNASRLQGSLTAFPSYVVHEITPVTEGTRYSLVGWITGPQFK